MNKENQSNLPTGQAGEHEWQVLVLLLKKISEQKGISQQEVANRTGMHRTNVNRLFLLKYPPTLKTFVSIAKAIEVNLFFEDKSGKTDLSKAFEAAMTELGRRKDALPDN